MSSFVTAVVGVSSRSGVSLAPLGTVEVRSYDEVLYGETHIRTLYSRNLRFRVRDLCVADAGGAPSHHTQM
jgi:hypothetical protein